MDGSAGACQFAGADTMRLFNTLVFEGCGCGCLLRLLGLLVVAVLLFAALDVIGIHFCDVPLVGGALCDLLNIS